MKLVKVFVQFTDGDKRSYSDVNDVTFDDRWSMMAIVISNTRTLIPRDQIKYVTISY